MIRAIIIFLLGVGAATGAYLTGATQRIPGIATWVRYPDSGGGGERLAASVPHHIADLSEFASRADDNCVPVYALDNRTERTVLVTFGGRPSSNPSPVASADGGGPPIMVRPGEKVAGPAETEDEGGDATVYRSAFGADGEPIETTGDQPHNPSVCRSGISMISIEITECGSGVCSSR